MANDYEELIPEMLEAISGGTMDEEQEGHIYRVMKAFKGAGATKAYTIATLSAFTVPGTTISSVTIKEVTDYINAHWDEV